MVGHDIIAIGASAGGAATLPKLIRSIPTGLPPAVFIVAHMAGRTSRNAVAQAAGVIPDVIAERTAGNPLHGHTRKEIPKHARPRVRTRDGAPSHQAFRPPRRTRL